MPTKKIYTKEFKEQAVPLAQKNGNISETARSLGLHDSILRRWKMDLEQNAEKAFPGKGHSQDEEVCQLQRENQRLKETVEILKRPWVSSSTAPSKIPVYPGSSESVLFEKALSGNGGIHKWLLCLD
jgi:transposase